MQKKKERKKKRWFGRIKLEERMESTGGQMMME